MRIHLHAPHCRALAKAASLFVLTGVLAACSNDASRFDQMLTASTQLTENQKKIIKSGSAVNQPYPGHAVRRAAAPVRAAPAPVIVSRGPLVAPVSRAQLPAVPSSTSSIRTSIVQAVKSKVPSYITSKTSVKPSTVAGMVHASAPLVLPPRPSKTDPLRMTGTDSTTTASIARVTAPVAASISKPASPFIKKSSPKTKPAGWQEKAGTTVEIKPGETLYNLSRRFGVPVSAIMKANGLTDADDVKAGAQISIPRYNYAEAAPVSAPDNNPVTKVSRSSRGFQGQARGRVPLPKTRVANNPMPGADKVDTMTTSSVPDTKKTSVKPVFTPPTPTAKAAKPKTRKVAKVAPTNFSWPVKGRILSRFGERNPSGANDGIDIAVPEGTPIAASDAGTVIYSGSELEDFGKLILISHNSGWVSAYAHANQTLVRRGDKVRRGQIIAKSGRTGNAEAPKLHFELRRNSTPVNPLKHLTK